jgi:hypothetical protein
LFAPRRHNLHMDATMSATAHDETLIDWFLRSGRDQNVDIPLASMKRYRQ